MRTLRQGVPPAPHDPPRTLLLEGVSEGEGDAVIRHFIPVPPMYLAVRLADGLWRDNLLPTSIGVGGREAKVRAAIDAAKRQQEDTDVR
jgi:hypothetical protein